jgi:hypothetical protein
MSAAKGLQFADGEVDARKIDYPDTIISTHGIHQFDG